MPTSVDWVTKVITVELDSGSVSGSNPAYFLDTNAFHLELRALEADSVGVPYLTTHNHNTEVVLGGVTYARVIEIINGYTVTFEDGIYAMSLEGSNNNILDVVNLNGVSVRSGNSAGLIVAGSGVTLSDIEDIAEAVWDEPVGDHTTDGTTGKKLGKDLTKPQFIALD